MAQLGVLYVAFGAPYLSMALISAASVRATNPQAQLCILTNVTGAYPAVDWWVPSRGDLWIYMKEPTKQNRSVKTALHRHSPFENTLFLDCDTIVRKNFSTIGILLDYFDIVLKTGEDGPDRKRALLNGALAYGETVHFNSGVIGFRKNSATEEFFSLWHAMFQERGKSRDQPSLVEALCASRVRLFPLHSKWNHGDYWYLPRPSREGIGIWHYKARGMDHRIEKLLRQSVHWFGGDKAASDEVEKFILRRRSQRKNWTIRNIRKTLARELGGPLSNFSISNGGDTI